MSNLSPPLNPHGSCCLFLPFTKIAKSTGESILICKQLDGSEPISAISSHLSINSFPSYFPLFSYLSPCRVCCLTKWKLMTLCNEIWSLHGLSPCSGHSFSIGSTTEMLLSGVSPDVVKAMGHWSSDSFLHYWFSLKLLGPLHIELLPPPASTHLSI
ncbi:hypothetical protein PAXRUDRAFT_165062 [Paxillus rubicundulus Ve08.2h10]|uniref:Uncharacterized protein n=1 Tax=Paxillus rubicundulus Ve08.2h10 TaxID=930991 RepID=A0A0D0DIU8_9AGAM|nr:hypothetical protein PAXRUDRAFT_165062 [Paxillus rubicundulus Ve08.2h10]